jgi:hypothetical protein
MVQQPSGFYQLVFYHQTLPFGQFLESQQLTEPKEQFLTNSLDFNLYYVYSIFEH